MSRTNPWHLVLLAIAGGVVLWVVEVALVASGRPAFVPQVPLGIAVGGVGVLAVVLALPVRRVARREPNARVDPFYATRVVALAKASSIIGAIIAGGALGILFFLLTRAVPSGSSLLMTLASLGGGVVLLAGGLVAEWMCTLTPTDDDPDEEAAL